MSHVAEKPVARMGRPKAPEQARSAAATIGAFASVMAGGTKRTFRTVT